jgi:hypothetical protein
MYRADPVLIVFGGVSCTHITKEKPEQGILSADGEDMLKKNGAEV